MKLVNLALVFAAMVCASSASATPISDQKFDTVSGHGLGCALIGNHYESAQTFTVGTSGRLTSVTFLHFWKSPALNSYPDLLFYVSRVDASGAPDAAASGRLVEKVITPDQITLSGPETYALSLNISMLANIQVTQGQKLAIGIRGFLPAGSDVLETVPYSVEGAVGTTGYPGYMGGCRYNRLYPWDGKAWTAQPDQDLFFQTFVDPEVVPEPSSVMAIIAGIAGLGGFARRRLA